jgi:transposase
MGYIAVGMDVSKGYADIAILNESFTELHTARYDDTAAGHRQLHGVLEALEKRYPDAVFVVGAESTGGLERNWLTFLRRWNPRTAGIRVHRLQPMSVKRHMSVDLHRAVTDASAAVGIARYLLDRMCDCSERDNAPSPAVVLYRTLRSMIQRRVEIQQQIHALLSQVHPELVQYARSGFARWLIDLLERYPTAERLARAKVETVDAIPTVLRDRAEKLVAAARTSVASLHGAGVEHAMRLLILQWRDLDRAIDDGQKAISVIVDGDPVHADQVRLMETIPGIGRWTACVLSLEIGNFGRFRDDRGLIAWCGLDPHEDRSGDGVFRRGISHRGNAEARRALFLPALTATRHLPDVTALWERLLARGRSKLVATVACMNKLLRIAFAVVRTRKSFDPHHEQHRRESAARQQHERSSPTPMPPTAVTPSVGLDAPISAREARRRRGMLRKQEAAARGSQSAGSEPQGDPHEHTASTA